MEDHDVLAAIVGKNITRLRKAANLTQLELAEKLNYSDKSISKWEQGNGIPDVRILMQLADLFGVSLDDLVREHEEKEVLPKTARLRNRVLTVILSSGLCWLVAVCCFVLLGIFWGDYEGMRWKWLSFVFAIPASAVVVIVFSTIWRWKWTRIIAISTLVWTALGCVYLVAYACGQNIWLIFLIGIPLQLLTLFYFVWRKRRKN